MGEFDVLNDDKNKLWIWSTSHYVNMIDLIIKVLKRRFEINEFGNLNHKINFYVLYTVR